MEILGTSEWERTVESVVWISQGSRVLFIDPLPELVLILASMTIICLQFISIGLNILLPFSYSKNLYYIFFEFTSHKLLSCSLVHIF